MGAKSLNSVATMRATRSGESALLLLDVVDLLSDQNIDHAVVGALAASIHGAMRASMDADMAKNPDGYCGLKGAGISCSIGGSVVVPAH